MKRGFPGKSNCGETLGKTQDMMETLKGLIVCIKRQAKLIECKADVLTEDCISHISKMHSIECVCLHENAKYMMIIRTLKRLGGGYANIPVIIQHFSVIYQS